MGKGKKKKPPQKSPGQQPTQKPKAEAEESEDFPAIGKPHQQACKSNKVVHATVKSNGGNEFPAVSKSSKSNGEIEISAGVESVHISDKKQSPVSAQTPTKKETVEVMESTPEKVIPQGKELFPPEDTAVNGKNSPTKITMMTTNTGFVPKQFEPPRASSRNDKVGRAASRVIKVEVNFVPMTINVPGGTIYHYDTDFKFPWKHELKKSDRPFLIRVVEAFKKTHAKILGNPYHLVYDGLKNIYTFRRLNFTDDEFEGKTQITKDESASSEEVEMVVKMKLVNQVPVNYAVDEYIRRGTSLTRPVDAIQILNIILGMTPQLRYVTVGRNYFNHDHKDCVVDLGGGKSLWVGTFKSVRMGWQPMLNIDMANKPAYEKSSVLDFAKKMVNSGRGRQNSSQGFLQDRRELELVENEIRGLKVRYVRPDGGKRDYRVNKLMEPANKLKMKIDSGEIMTIQRYFKITYKSDLKYPGLPCLHVGDPKKSIYVPMEFCELKQQIAPSSKRMSDRESANMIRETAVPPHERKKRIEDNMKAMSNYYESDPYAKAFGIQIKQKWLTFDARVLRPPMLTYQLDGGNNKTSDVKFEKVFEGKWNMGAMRDKDKFKFVRGSELSIWGFLDLARLRDDEKEKFINGLYEEGLSRGLKIDYPTYSSADSRNLNGVEKAFLKLRDDIKTKNGKEPQLIMIVSAEKGPFRNCLKYLGDAVLRIPTQFVMKPNAIGKDHHGPNAQTLHNICLKLNSKIGGVNQALHKLSIPKILQTPVMIMGADVTHPSPGDMSKKPSIAAVVGSCDAKASFYNAEVRLQNSGQAVEIIEKMEEMTLSLLKKFQNHNNGNLPFKIIFYRDGVSEGQFIEVLNSELRAIRKACMAFGDKFKPAITFIVAQKRHKTFPKPVKDSDGVGSNKNVPPGTVIDTEICHPTEKDFYLASQLAIKGTVKPAHYHILWDDSKLSPDDLQRLTFDLCHLYSRCERSVSYPAPTYYSHLAAFRAREHHNALIAKTPKLCAEEVRKEDIQKMEHLDIKNYFI